jgi:adenosylcobinamide kinase/adenosylcobinamide-phosphate guanylyltransferase
VRELLIGGQKSGKSAQAERLAQRWLAASEVHSVVLIVTARGLDDEMRFRIERHQADREVRFGKSNKRFITVEEPLNLASSVIKYSSPSVLLIVDCLTLWLTNWIMPDDLIDSDEALSRYQAQEKAFLNALKNCNHSVVLVSNEIGWGVIPMGTQARRFVDVLGVLNQQVASVCDTVTLMAAGLPLTMKHST